MNGEQLREQLHTGARVYGTHVTSAGNALATRLLGGAPLDFVFVCNEHMPADRAEASALCQQFGAMGISPVVRVPYPCALDGADLNLAIHSLKQRRTELCGDSAAAPISSARKEPSTRIAP